METDREPRPLDEILDRLPYTLDLRDPKELIPNPENWARHSDRQRAALRASVEAHGRVDEPLINARTGHIIDGHLRVEDAIRDGETEIVVKVLDISLEDELSLLAQKDAVAELREREPDRLGGLLLRLQDAERVPTVFQEDPKAMRLLEAARRERDGEPAGNGRTDGLTPPGKDAFLSEPFGIIPTTVLDFRGEAWQARRKAWCHYGLMPQPTAAPAETKPGFYAAKREYEEQHGEKLSVEEFAEVWRHDRPEPTTAFFDPVFAEAAIRWFTPAGGRVLDLYDGGAVRGLVAATLGRSYTGLGKPEGLDVNRSLAEDLGVQGCGWLGACAEDAVFALRADGGACPVFDLVFFCPTVADLADCNTGMRNRLSDAADAARTLLHDHGFMVALIPPGWAPEAWHALSHPDRPEAGPGPLWSEGVVILPADGELVETVAGFGKTRKLATSHALLMVFRPGGEGDPLKLEALDGSQFGRLGEGK
jgi:hypothetical protein